MGRRKTNFEDSLLKNMWSYKQYYNMLIELAISSFEWVNIPATVDERFLELTLLTKGNAVFFQDDVLGYLALTCAINGPLDVYNIPLRRRAYASNGYQNELNAGNSVLIYNNYLHTNSIYQIRGFAERLANIDRACDVNVNAQKTPVLIVCDETQRLTMQNLYKQYDGNEPVIYGNKALSVEAIKSINTGAPYVSDKLYDLKTKIWNEALTYLGIANVQGAKKERMITDEVIRGQGGTIAARYSRLESRRKACKQINDMFDLDIWCNFRDTLDDGGDIVE